MIFAVFMILSPHFESLSSQFQGQNSFDEKQILEESFKERLLKELGLSSAPNVSDLKAPEIPAILKYLVDAENRKLQEEDEGFYSKTTRIFLFPEKGKPRSFRLGPFQSVLPVYLQKTDWYLHGQHTDSGQIK